MFFSLIHLSFSKTGRLQVIIVIFKEETMSGSKDNMEEYRKKRDFGKTTEPGDEVIDFEWAEHPVFVIQKHDASRLHYDFRIEVDGVLKSWAVPKGPSTGPGDKRLAVLTEDHPLAYADFEGVIPEAQYGGGTVMVWDRGSYRNMKEEEGGKVKSVSEQFRDGHITIRLKGEKLRGGYALIRTSGGDDKQWLLIKMNDQEADARRKPLSTQPASVKSGRSLEEIRREEGD